MISKSKWPFLMLSGAATTAIVLVGNDHSHVAAYNDFSKRSFPECKEQNLSPEECKILIEDQIKSEGRHEVHSVKVKIQRERSRDAFNDSYWMVEVPTTFDGHPGWCDKEGGTSFYPFMWDIIDDEGKEASVPVEGVGECATAVDCCLKIRDYGKTLSPSGYDKNGQCLSCFIHRDTLVPVHVDDYLYEFTRYLGLITSDPYNPESLNEPFCEIGEVNENQLDEADDESYEQVADALSKLTEFFETYASYDDINNDTCNEFNGPLLKSLYTAALHLKPLSQKIGQLACMVCFGGENDRTDLIQDSDVQKLVEEMKTLMGKNVDKNDPNAQIKSYLDNDIVIYATNDGDKNNDIIKTVPQLGGLRAEYFLQRADEILKKRYQCYYYAQDCVSVGCDPVTEYCFEEAFLTSKCLPKRCNEEEHQCAFDEVCNYVYQRHDEITNLAIFEPTCIKSCITNPSICDTSNFEICDTVNSGVCVLEGMCTIHNDLCPEDQFCSLYYVFNGPYRNRRQRKLAQDDQYGCNPEHPGPYYSDWYIDYEDIYCDNYRQLGDSCDEYDFLCSPDLLCYHGAGDPNNDDNEETCPINYYPHTGFCVDPNNNSPDYVYSKSGDCCDFDHYKDHPNGSCSNGFVCIATTDEMVTTCERLCSENNDCEQGEQCLPSEYEKESGVSICQKNP